MHRRTRKEDGNDKGHGHGHQPINQIQTCSASNHGMSLASRESLKLNTMD